MRHLAIAAATVAAFAGVGSAIGLSSGPEERGGCPSPSGHEVVLTVPLPARPGFLLRVKTTLWVGLAARHPGGQGALVRLDARSGRVRGTFRLPFNPYRLAYGFGSLWITGEVSRENRRFAGLLRVDPRSGRVLKVIRGARPFGSALAVTSDGVWVGGGDSYPVGHPGNTVARFVFKVDPRSDAVVRTVRLDPTTVIDLEGDGPALWATGWGAVVKISASGRLLFQQRFDGSGWAMALTTGAVWVAQPFFGNRDPRTQRPAQRLLKVATSGPRRLTVIELSLQPGDVSAAGGFVWVGADGVVRIDAAEPSPAVTRVAAGVIPNRIDAFRGGAWVGSRRANQLSKIC